MTHPPQGQDDRDDVRPISPPPVPPPASGWGRQDPARGYPAPQPGQQYGQPAYGQPSQYGQPAYGPPSQYGQPGSGQQYGQPPQYGQPGGWGQPARPARRSRRRWVSLLGLLGVVLLATVVVALTTGPRSTALDPQAVQRDVARQFQQQSGAAVDLRCRDTMAVDPGRTYRCSGTTTAGAPVTIIITITNENADYTWSEG
jgi:hypothetical protein